MSGFIRGTPPWGAGSAGHTASMTRPTTIIFRLALLALGVLAPAMGDAAAKERVYFERGHRLVVERVEIEDGVATLFLSGGAQAQVAESSIRDIRRLVPDPPPPPKIVWPGEAEPYAEYIEAAAERHAVEPALIVAVAQVESRFDPFAISPKGAQGLMQLMPATADELEVDDPFDPAQNIDGGTRWLKRLIERYEGDIDLALAAYNAGEGAVARYGGIPPFRETQNYVRSVRERYRRLAEGTVPGA